MTDYRKLNARGWYLEHRSEIQDKHTLVATTFELTERMVHKALLDGKL